MGNVSALGCTSPSMREPKQAVSLDIIPIGDAGSYLLLFVFLPQCGDWRLDRIPLPISPSIRSQNHIL